MNGRALELRHRPPTQLQQAQQALQDLFADARADLTPAAYVVFINYAVDVVAHEAGRIQGWRGEPDGIEAGPE